MRIGPSVALAFGLVASAVDHGGGSPVARLHHRRLGHRSRPAHQLRQRRRPDARRLPVDRDAERAAPLRRPALRRLRSRQHAGAGARPRRAPVRRRHRDAVGQHLRRIADLGAARGLPARMDRRRPARFRSVPGGIERRRAGLRHRSRPGDPAPRRRERRLGRPPSARRRAAALRRGRAGRAVGARRRRRAVAAARRALRRRVDGRPARQAGPVPGARRRRPGVGRHRGRDRGVRRRPLPDDDADQRRGAARRLAAALLAGRRAVGGGQRPRPQGARPDVDLDRRGRARPDRPLPRVGQLPRGSPRRRLADALRQGRAARPAGRPRPPHHRRRRAAGHARPQPARGSGRERLAGHRARRPRPRPRRVVPDAVHGRPARDRGGLGGRRPRRRDVDRVDGRRPAALSRRHPRQLSGARRVGGRVRLLGGAGRRPAASG